MSIMNLRATGCHYCLHYLLGGSAAARSSMAITLPPSINDPLTGAEDPPLVVTYRTSRKPAVLPNAADVAPATSVELRLPATTSWTPVNRIRVTTCQ